MNRLTKRAKNGLAYSDIPLNQSSVLDANENIVECYTGTIAERIAAYEDTGLEPEEMLSAMEMVRIKIALDELKKYKDLEEQGRLHIAPIPNGTEIFAPFIDHLDDAIDEIIESTYLHGLTEYEWGEINKDWFLTREEAEKALKEVEVENE